PEIGTVAAARRPSVILTSNRTRELHDALKRRCLFHWIGHPTLEREIEVVVLRVPGIPERLAAQAALFVRGLRGLDLAKPPGVAAARGLDVGPPPRRPAARGHPRLPPGRPGAGRGGGAASAAPRRPPGDGRRWGERAAGGEGGGRGGKGGRGAPRGVSSGEEAG